MDREKTETFVSYAVREFEVALRSMLKENHTIHLFDFDGTTNGVKEQWSFLIAVAPKKQMEVFEQAIRCGPKDVTGARRPEHAGGNA